MKKVNVEENFSKMIEELTDSKVYVPTEEHSSGFNEIEIEDMGNGTYSISIEGDFCMDDYLTFEELKIRYPKIALDKISAFYEKFKTWNDIAESLD